VSLAPNKIGDLLRLKRHEQPSAAYFDDFLREFQSRQREELMRRPGWELFRERVSEWLGDLGGVRWAYTAGVAYASLLLGLFFWPHGDQRATLPAAPVGYDMPLTAPADVQDGLDLRATGDELPEQEF